MVKESARHDRRGDLQMFHGNETVGALKHAIRGVNDSDVVICPISNTDEKTNASCMETMNKGDEV